MALLDSSMLVVMVGTFMGILLVRKMRQKCTGPKVPPGPIPLPIIGNLYQLARRPNHAHITFHELAKKYGDIFTISIFNTKYIVLNTQELCKEVFQRNMDAFSNRPMTYSFKLLNNHKRGLVFQEDGSWRGIRKLAVSSLHHFDKISLESRVLEATNSLVDVMAEHDGKPFDPSLPVTEAVNKVIASVCFGPNIRDTDDKFKSMIHKLAENLENFNIVEPIDYIPILQLLPLPARIKNQLTNLLDVNNYIQTQIDGHRATFNENNLRDLIDLYLLKEVGEVDFLSETDMIVIIRDLFVAGTETTATSIRWALLYLIHYPQIQRRLSNEIEQLIGHERELSLTDKTRLDYLQAFIMEILRHGSIAYATVPHLCTADRQIGGYTIPKGAVVIGNIYHIHKSEKYWKNPSQFNPDRFLNADGKLLTTKNGFIAFGTGSRQCIGESLAWRELFLILGCLIQKFTFKPVDEDNLPPVLGKAKIILAPENFKIRAMPK